MRIGLALGVLVAVPSLAARAPAQTLRGEVGLRAESRWARAAGVEEQAALSLALGATWLVKAPPPADRGLTLEAPPDDAPVAEERREPSALFIYTGVDPDDVNGVAADVRLEARGRGREPGLHDLILDERALARWSGWGVTQWLALQRPAGFSWAFWRSGR